MMSTEIMAAKPASKEESHGSNNGRKGSSSRPPDQQALKCPRCDSPNTKFCYYNNYSLSQPRHFCKTCRRYWTKGGALRNVPIGGGCRKNKKLKSSSRLSGDSKDHSGGTPSDIGGLKFFQGLSPAMDFQLDISSTSGAIASSPCFTLDPSGGSGSPLMGFNFPAFLPSLIKQGSEGGNLGLGGGFSSVQEMGSLNIHSNIASSIESLSSINQDLHWKLQQQRLAMLFGGGDQAQQNHHKESSVSSVPLDTQIQKPQPILFENLEISKPEEACGIGGGVSRRDQDSVPTEWYFGNPYAVANPTPTPAQSSSNGNESAGNWTGIQTWTNLNHFSAIP